VLPVLVILFVLVPLAELAIILQVGDLIGFWWTIVLLIADSILGSLLMRAQGRAAWRRFTEATRAGRPPAKEVIDGALVIVGGALLLTPGFISDALGLALLLPPSRAVIRAVLVRRLAKRMVVSMTGPAAPGRPPGRPAGQYDIEGTAVDVDRP
jgi:UPF0716 protein FxsA